MRLSKQQVHKLSKHCDVWSSPVEKVVIYREQMLEALDELDSLLDEAVLRDDSEMCCRICDIYDRIVVMTFFNKDDCEKAGYYWPKTH